MFLIHLGLPKTATTSLQYDYFPVLNEASDCFYIGVNQPRHSRKQTEAYRLINDYMSGCTALGIAKNTLDSIYTKHETIIFSDEMIMVSSGNSSWLSKLSRLAMLVKSYDFKILLTVRDPIDASISYYVERYACFSLKSYLQCFQEEPDFRIFDYPYLMDTLDSLGLSQGIEIICFDDIVNNPSLALKPIDKLLSLPFKDKPFPIIRNRNIKNTLLERIRERPQTLSFYSAQNKIIRVLITSCLSAPILSQLFVKLLQHFYPKSLRIVSKLAIPDDEKHAAREIDRLRYVNRVHWRTFMTSFNNHHD